MRTVQVLLTSVARCLSESRVSIIKIALIETVKRLYKVDMSSAVDKNYTCFDDFFTRDFHSSARSISKNGLINPVDGCISDFGLLDNQDNLVIKHKDYTPEELLYDGANFIGSGSSYVSYYLAPYNHHQIYMPADGKIVKSVYVPGLLYSVKPDGIKSQQIVNFKNERLILFIDSEFGPLVIVLVGALLVGSMSTAWGKRYTPNSNLDVIIEECSYEFTRGSSIARFHYGSSVILITKESLGKLTLGANCLMGEPIWS